MADTRKKVDDSTTLFDRWTYDNIDDDTKGVVDTVNDFIVYTDEIPEIKDGQKTGGTVTKAYIYIKIGKTTKPAPASKAFINEMTAKHGSKIAEWVGKNVKFQHKKFGTTNYIELKA